MFEKRPEKSPKSPKVCAMCTNISKPSTGRILGYVAQIQIPRALHPQPPTFCGFQASESRNEPPRPPYRWSLGAVGGQPGPRTARANGGAAGAPGAKKKLFSKVVRRPLGMLKPVFLARFEPVVARFGPWKIPKCLENGLVWNQKWVKSRSKTCFSKSDPRPFGMLKQVFLAHFESVLTKYSPFRRMYAPNCALRTYLRAVWWSHRELGRGV